MALVRHRCQLTRLSRPSPIQITKRHLSGRNDRDPKFYHNLINSFLSPANRLKPTIKPKTEQEKKIDDLFGKNLWNRDYYGKSIYSSFLWDGKKPITRDWAAKVNQELSRELKAIDTLFQDLTRRFGIRNSTQEQQIKKTTKQTQAQTSQTVPTVQVQQDDNGQIDLITMRRKQQSLDLKDNKEDAERVEIEDQKNDQAKQQEDPQESSFEQWREHPQQKRPDTIDNVTHFSPVIEEISCFNNGRVEAPAQNDPVVTTQLQKKRASNDHHDELDMPWGGLESLDRPTVNPPGVELPPKNPERTPPEVEQHWVWEDSSHEARHQPSHPPAKEKDTGKSKQASPLEAKKHPKTIKDEISNPRNSEGLSDAHDPFERELEVDDITHRHPDKMDPKHRHSGEQSWRDIFERPTDSEGLDPAHKQKPRSNIHRKASTVLDEVPFEEPTTIPKLNILPDTPLTAPQLILALQSTPTGPTLVSIPYIPSTTSASTSTPPNVLSLLHILDNKPIFFSQFERLQKEGYALVDGGVDFLVFQKTEAAKGEAEGKPGKKGGMGWSVVKTGVAMGVGAGGLYAVGKWAKSSRMAVAGEEAAVVGRV